ncbi:predicted protein [Nematostella vectensis]|uniref:ATP-dependent DNA helicase n=1 Tax=Nematostella vectensis TaxID=45351 RepID=A7T019_NEMVE|nr:predicted protein [Nematostella vectensis]|eukprot:XP_001622795.1 hypothetical protein NEMVEDRAFT_v1g220219 [Nematostella vectensis]
MDKLRSLNKPIATIKARHSGGAQTLSADEIGGEKSERQQLPLKLAWAMTIHKSQGLTLKKAWVDIGTSEKSPGMTYVALSRDFYAYKNPLNDSRKQKDSSKLPSIHWKMSSQESSSNPNPDCHKGYIHNVSPVKRSKNKNQWFDYQLQVSPTKVRRFVGFNIPSHANLKEHEESKTAVALGTQN